MPSFYFMEGVMTYGNIKEFGGQWISQMLKHPIC